jgi:hypothetical protein
MAAGFPHLPARSAEPVLKGADATDPAVGDLDSERAGGTDAPGSIAEFP